MNNSTGHTSNHEISTYRQAEAYLYDLRMFGTKLGLANITALLDLIGNPHHHLYFVHIAGTNGKGSVGAMLNALLTAAGLRTGMFTSPHLVSMRERFKINNRAVTPQAFVRSFNRVKRALDTMHTQDIYPTFFEVVTAIALDYFARKKVDIVLWETGMGGSLDATNAVNARTAVITNVSLDHCTYLGDTVAKIAREKAGIIKPGSTLITGSTDPDAVSVFEEICRRQNADMVLAPPDAVKLRRKTSRGMVIDYHCDTRSIGGIELNQYPSYQLANSSIALAVFEELCRQGKVAASLFEQAVRDGFAHVRNPGRFQALRRIPPIILDGAHNPAGMIALKESVLDRFDGWTVHLLIGVLADKEYRQICSAIVPIAASVSCVTVPSMRSLSAADLAACCRDVVAPDIPVTVADSPYQVIDRFAKTYATTDRTVLMVCGSLYMIGDILKHYNKTPFTVHDKGTDYR